MTFDNFYAGKGYAYALKAAKKAANRPDGEYSPLILCGPSGIGKTHLLSAIATKARASRKNANIIQMASDDFTKELIASIYNDEWSSFREKYRAADMLLIDNFEQLAGREQTQEEMFMLFDWFVKENKPIAVCVSDTEEPGFSEKIKSRLQSGAIVNMTLPDNETKSAIVDGIAGECSLELDLQVKRLIIDRTDTAAQIKGVLKNIKMTLEIANRYPSLEEINKFLLQRK